MNQMLVLKRMGSPGGIILLHYGNSHLSCTAHIYLLLPGKPIKYKNGVEVMPWCPNCKNEFQEGFKICSDCNVELVDELTKEEEYIPFFQAEQRSIAEKLLKYFKYSDLKSVIRYNEEYEVYILYVPEGQFKQAKKLYQAFYFVELERHEKELEAKASKENSGDIKEEDTESIEVTTEEEPMTAKEIEIIHSSSEVSPKASDDIASFNHSEIIKELETDDTKADEELLRMDLESFKAGKALYSDTWNKDNLTEEDEVEEDIRHESNTYVMKADKFKDYSSTVWTFLFLGIAGFFFVILNIAGILTFLNGFFPNAVMGALFLFFIYVGLSTYKKAKKIQSEIEDENKMTEQINSWLKEHVTVTYLSSIHDDSVSEEINYIKICDAIKELLQENFGQQNEAYLDHLIEEYYSANFDNKNP